MASPHDPTPAVFWTLYREGKVAECRIAFVPNGVEVRILRNGSLLHSQVFPTGEEASAYVEAERTRTLEAGWVMKG